MKVLKDTHDDLSREEKDSLKSTDEYKKVVNNCLPVFRAEIKKNEKFQEICKVPSEDRVKELRAYLTMDRAANIVKWFRHKDNDSVTEIGENDITGPDYYMSFQKLRKCFGDFEYSHYEHQTTSKKLYLDGLHMHGFIMTILDLFEACDVVGNINTNAQ